jgi:Sulfotransferase domain
MRILSRTLVRLKYGEPIVVVSGLPRSGTSMLMNMLQSGGMQICADGQRGADHDNPRGYFEHERVKRLETEVDKRWLRQARGKAIKIISPLLRSLPPDNRYKIVLATRDLGQIIASQNKMLDRLCQVNPVDDEKALRLYEQHLRTVWSLASVRSNFEIMEAAYAEVLADPEAWAQRMAAFTGHELDCRRMAAVVECSLYRNRAGPGAAA